MKRLYLASDGKPRIKIGITNNPEKRLMSLRNSNVDIEYLWVSDPVLDAKEIEQKCLAHFKAHRVVGEWLAVSKDTLCTFLASLIREAQSMEYWQKKGEMRIRQLRQQFHNRSNKLEREAQGIYGNRNTRPPRIAKPPVMDLNFSGGNEFAAAKARYLTRAKSLSRRPSLKNRRANTST